MIVWALFDSGNGCYTQGAELFNQSVNQSIEIYPIGMDIESKNNHFINLNLADYGRMFGDNKLFDELDKLPKPDLIIASPPCESWSVASAMWGGNASWKQETGAVNRELSKFTVRSRADYDLPHVQFKYDRSFLNRINGELCIYNTIEIIKRYNPKVYVIENPASSKIWHYIDDILGFKMAKHQSCTANKAVPIYCLYPLIDKLMKRKLERLLNKYFLPLNTYIRVLY